MTATSDGDASTRDRARMIAEIERHFHETAAQTGEPALDPSVRRALETVARHLFVPDSLRERAYDDCPLPIGSDQTISQPFIVALMTQLARLDPESRCLEIGTGCGYQSAVLAELADRVYTIERIPELARRATEQLARLGYRDIAIRAGDGHLGWPEAAPFDAIVVTAGTDEIPATLVDQLAPDGRLVIPVASSRGVQELTVVTRNARGEISLRPVLPVAFVPFVRDPERPPEDVSA